MNKFKEETIRRKHIYKGTIIDVQVDDVLLPDGNESKRELVKHPGAVAILAITADDKIVLVEQYRKPLERSIIEIPAGKIETNEDPVLTAIRELEEETGYTTKKLNYIGSFATSPGFADEIIHLYFTDHLIQLDYDVLGDADEFIVIHEVNLEEAEQYIEEQKIFDAKTLYALMYYKLKRMESTC